MIFVSVQSVVLYWPPPNPDLLHCGPGNDLVDLVVPHPEQVRLLAVEFGQPPAVHGVDMVRLTLRRDLRLALDPAHVVLEIDPFAVVDAVVLRGVGMNLHIRVGIFSRSHGIMRCSEWKKSCERAPVIMTSGYFLNSSGVDRALRRLGVERQRIQAPLLEGLAVHLDLAARRVEARLAVRPQQPALVPAVGLGRSFRRHLPAALLVQLLEGHTRRLPAAR